MGVYRVGWSVICGAIAAAALVAACVAWTPAGVVLAYAMATLTLGCGAMLLPSTGDPASLDIRKAYSCVRSSTPGGAAALVALAMFNMMGLMAVPALVVAGATSPWLVGWVVGRTRSATRSRRCSHHTSLQAELDRAWEQLIRGEVARLSDTELCWAWRTSYQALNERADPSWHGQVVVVRATYLTELERRYPVQIAAWLASGPLPANGPERFLRAS